MLMLLYDSVDLVVSGVKLWIVTGAISQEKVSWEFFTATVGLCWMQDAPAHCLVEIWKTKLSLKTHLIAS